MRATAENCLTQGLMERSHHHGGKKPLGQGQMTTPQRHPNGNPGEMHTLDKDDINLFQAPPAHG